ncbi:hypothetical protein DL96DRAFT_1627435 [Flagelloscypha sp. PMI_526]|nr:hypothetical protein DL96DRAFT_1627435 [Flagelloscypha sp. PMI_526]
MEPPVMLQLYHPSISLLASMSSEHDATSAGPATVATSVKGYTPFLLSLTIVAPLWGIIVAQTSAYFRNYRKDRMFLKILILVCLVLTTAQLVALVYAIYFWLVICRIPENYLFLGALTQSFVVGPIYIIYIVITVVQLFYAMRVWIVSNKNKTITGIIVAMSLTQLISGIAQVTYMVSIGNVRAVYSKFNKVAGSIELASSMLCDIVISGALVWLLRGSKQSSFKGTRHAIDRLVLYSVNIGLLTNLVSLVNLVTWLAAPEDNFIFAIFHFSLGKIYVNSMLVSLNARDKIRGKLVAENVHGTSVFDVDGINATSTSVPCAIPLGNMSGKV